MKLRASLLFLAASLGVLSFIDAAPRAPQQELTLRFRWPDKGHVTVIALSEKKGNEFGCNYKLRWAPDSTGKFLTFQIEDFTVDFVNDFEADDPEIRKVVEFMEAQQSNIPAWLVNRDGSYAGMTDAEFKKVSDGLIANLPKGSKEREVIRNSFAMESTKATVIEAAGSDWWSWVGVWLNAELPEPLELVEGEVSSELAGIPIDARFEFEREALADDRGVKCVHLYYSEMIDGDAFTAALETFMDRLGPNTPPPGLIESAYRMIDIDATVEVDTLRPHEVLMSKKTSVTVDGKTQVQWEEKFFIFDWDDLEPIDWDEEVDFVEGFSVDEDGNIDPIR